MFIKELKYLKKFPDKLNIHSTFSQTNEKGANFGRIDEGIINFVLNQSKNKPSSISYVVLKP